MTTSNQKNIPALRFKEFDGFYLLSKLSSILDRYSEKNKDEEFSINDILSLSVRCGIVSRKKLLEDRYEKVNHLNYIKTRVGDFVYGKSISASCPYGVFKANNYTDGLLSTLYYTFKVRKNIIPTYLDYYFSHLNRADNFLKKYVLVGARYITADVNYILSGEIFIPSKKEQQKVARFLTAIDQKINQLSQKVALQERYKKGVTQKLFSQELRFKDADGKDFADWEEKRITEIAKTSIGLVTSMTKHYVDNGIPLIRNSDIKQNRIRKSKLINLEIGFAKENEHKKLRINDIVTVHTGDIGVSAIIDEEMDGCLGFATLNTRIIKKELVIPEYLCWYYNSINNIRYAVSMATGDGRSNYNLKDFNKAKIPLPHIQEQRKIAHFLSQLDEQIQQTRQQLAHLQDYKKGLLQQLFVYKEEK